MKILFRISLLFLFCLLLGSCKKDHSVLGVDVQPAGDALNTSYTDTSTIYAFTIKNDSTACANDRYKYLGSNLDPYFGRMDVGLYLNTTIDATFLNFGADAHVTSSEIILAIDNVDFVGDPTAQLTYSVFAIDSVLNPLRVYYTSNDGLHSSKNLLSVSTSSYSLSKNGKSILHIPVSNAYAGAILNNPDFLVNNDVFQKNYKGFYILASGSNPGVIYQCNVEDDLSGFYIYYQNGTPSATKTDKAAKFPFSGVTSAKYNTVNYLPSQGGTNSLVQQIVNNDPTQGKENLFLKGLGATKVKVYIPSLKNYADSFHVAVSRAELIFNVDTTFASAIGKYAPPPKLALLAMNSEEREIYVRDQVDNTRYDGNYDAVNHRYVFNIARQVELIMQGAIVNYGFYLVIANTDLIYATSYYGTSKELLSVRRDNYISRVILAGSNKGSLKPKLNLTYVKIRNH